MKLLMQETFVNAPPALNSYDEVHNLEDQSIVVSLAPPNLLQDSEQKQEDKDDMDKTRSSHPHVKIQSHHFTMHLLLSLKLRAKVMLMVLHSWMVRLLLMC